MQQLMSKFQFSIITVFRIIQTIAIIIALGLSIFLMTGRACHPLDNSWKKHRIKEKCSITATGSNAPRETDLVVAVFCCALAGWVCVSWGLLIGASRIRSRPQGTGNDGVQLEVLQNQEAQRAEPESLLQSESSIPSSSTGGGSSEQETRTSPDKSAVVTTTTTSENRLVTGSGKNKVVDVALKRVIGRLEVVLWTWGYRGDFVAVALAVVVCGLATADLMESWEYGKLSGSHDTRVALGVFVMSAGFMFFVSWLEVIVIVGSYVKRNERAALASRKERLG